MQRVPARGTPPWSDVDLAGLVGEFADLYRRRPLAANEGGMRAPHMFATWVIVRTLRPPMIVESGTWKGQGTWLLEQAAPDAELLCIDPVHANREWTSSRANYTTTDFDDLTWSDVPEGALVMFDDHQDGYRRIRQAAWHGFHHAIYEDNYPPGIGDCYSLRKAWAGAGHTPPRQHGLKGTIRNLLGAPPTGVPAVDGHALALDRHLEVYAEFPPLAAPERDRWGDLWGTIPTLPPVSELSSLPPDLATEAHHYTWIAYVEVR